MEYTKPKRLTIELPPELHAEVKSRAAYRNISIRTYVLRALKDKINNEKKYEDGK